MGYLKQIPEDIDRNKLEKRFWSKVNKQEVDGCWEWTACLKPQGYGNFGIGRNHMYAHRLSWEMSNGPIPEGMLICHKCDNRKCVRQDHLFLGTVKDNSQDALKKGRLSKPPVKWGVKNQFHVFTEDQVREIRRRYRRESRNVSNASALAQEFGVTKDAVKRVLARKTWAWVV